MCVPGSVPWRRRAQWLIIFLGGLFLILHGLLSEFTVDQDDPTHPHMTLPKDFVSAHTSDFNDALTFLDRGSWPLRPTRTDGASEFNGDSATPSHPVSPTPPRAGMDGLLPTEPSSLPDLPCDDQTAVVAPSPPNGGASQPPATDSIEPDDTLQTKDRSKGEGWDPAEEPGMVFLLYGFCAQWLVALHFLLSYNAKLHQHRCIMGYLLLLLAIGHHYQASTAHIYNDGIPVHDPHWIMQFASSASSEERSLGIGAITSTASDPPMASGDHAIAALDRGGHVHVHAQAAGCNGQGVDR